MLISAELLHRQSLLKSDKRVQTKKSHFRLEFNRRLLMKPTLLVITSMMIDVKHSRPISQFQHIIILNAHGVREI